MRYLTTLFVGLLLTAAALSVAVPAQAQSGAEVQCLSRDECRALRESLRETNRELRPMRREMRQFRHQIRETPEGDERDALIAQARELHREIKRIRRARRPEVRQFREGCRRECFAD